MYANISGGDALLNRTKRKDPWIILIIFDILLLGLVLFYYFIAFSPIKGNSMMNTLQWGQCVLLQRHGYELERGDIITINIAESGEPHILIKRVVALGGDRVLFVRSADDKTVDMYICRAGSDKFDIMREDYIPEPMKWDKNPDSKLYENVTVIKHIDGSDIQNTLISVKYDDEQSESVRQKLLVNSLLVPENKVFFLGDNRNNSNDSRHYGTQPTSKIIGKVIKIIEQGSALEGFMRFMFNTYERA